MNKFIIILVIVCAFVIISDVQAKSRSKSDDGLNPYTHCGIGAAIFPDTHWAAATSNAVWDLGITAITSAISSPETCNAKVKRTAQLIIETLPDLEKDVAMGEGTYVVALADTMGCSTQTEQVAQTMRSNYTAKVSDASYASKTDAERAYDMYDTARTAAKDAGCGAQL